MMVEGWKTHSKMRENRAGKRTILIDGRGSENALVDDRKIGFESTLFKLMDQELENALEDDRKIRLENALF